MLIPSLINGDEPSNPNDRTHFVSVKQVAKSMLNHSRTKMNSSSAGAVDICNTHGMVASAQQIKDLFDTFKYFTSQGT